MIKLFCKDPFRIFFPVAIFYLLYASGLWIFYGIFDIGDFPVSEHANLFIGGYLYFSILGFLLTAIPRFTDSEFLTKYELLFFLIVIIFNLIFFFLNLIFWFWLDIFLGLIFLFVFGAKRFLKRKQNPPFTFLFVGMGILIGIFGSLFNSLLNLNEELFFYLEPWGKVLFYDGMTTSFVIGVGGRLIPGILGFKDIIINQREIYEKSKSFIEVLPVNIQLMAILYFVSLLLEGFGREVIGYIARAIVITYMSIKYWRIHTKVKTGKWHGRILRISCWFILIASWILCFKVDVAIHVKHLIYIGTYLLMTIMVASRVIIAHGYQSSLEFEHRIFPYLITGSLIALAAILRFLVIFSEPDNYNVYLGFVGFLVFFSALAWSLIFLKKIFNTRMLSS
ncbi:MAG: NnrS family protein [Halobacteriovoraceae bacterium]|nr:NnrS family protein [Halobacteriovoraceae bacterium]MCB9095827.1 NnrS family protein [Halobacteriovoraceae bacterium]